MQMYSDCIPWTYKEAGISINEAIPVRHLLGNTRSSKENIWNSAPRTVVLYRNNYNIDARLNVINGIYLLNSQNN
jgi:hypothetical protein